MRLIDFLLHHTQCYELCVIREKGWTKSIVWVDKEKIFTIHLDIANLEVDGDYWGALRTTSENGGKVIISAHYIECHYVDKEEK